MALTLDYRDYTVAWIAVLPIEAEAALGMLDKQHEGHFRTGRGDDFLYIGGEVNGHNVVIATWPLGQNYGVGSAAALASQVKVRFENLFITLLVGIAAGIPNLSSADPQICRDIRLGDVLVAVPDKSSTGVIQYDLGRDTDLGFIAHGRLLETATVVRSAFADIRLRHPEPFRRGNMLAGFVQQLVQTFGRDKFQHPGQDQDSLAVALDSPRDTETLNELALVTRQPREDFHLSHVWYGNLGSGNSLMRNSKRRDELRDQYDLIGLEMEAAGVMNVLPAGIIRGVCDYGDNQKNKTWQAYAAAVAAAYAKGVLCVIQPKMITKHDAISRQKLHTPHNFPFPRNEDVVIRKDVLAAIDELLPLSSKYQSAALWGLGGVGKTQMALEWADRRHGDFNWPVFWVHANDHDKFVQGYRQIANIAGLSAKIEGDSLLQAVRTWLEENGTWLLVIDNADDLRIFGLRSAATSADHKDLRKYIPSGSKGTILWTTRDERALGHLVGLRRGINVVGMTDEEATQLLTDFNSSTDHDSETVSAILEQLDWMPLALSSAASYMRETGLSMEKYLVRLQHEKGRWRLLAAEGPSRHRQENIPNSVMSTWAVTMEFLRDENPLAFWILEVCAYFHNQEIPIEFVKTAVKLKRRYGLRTDNASIARRQFRASMHDECDNHVGGTDDSNEDEEEDLMRSAIRRLSHFSFLRMRTAEAGHDTFDIHKLVHQAVRHARRHLQPANNLDNAVCVSLQVLHDLFPDGGRYKNWRICERYIQHATIVCSWQEVQSEKELISSLLALVTPYLCHQGRFNDAEELSARSFELHRELFGPRHSQTIRAMVHFASIKVEKGYYHEAQSMLAQALYECEEIFGEQHEVTVRLMAGLAYTYARQQKYDKVEGLQRRLLEMRQNTLGAKHEDTLQSMHFLAISYDQQGRYVEAEQLYLVAIATYRETLGESHLSTIECMSNLGLMYYKQGQLQKAEELMLLTLKLHKDALGDLHIQTMLCTTNLAAIYFDQSRHEEAARLFVSDLGVIRQVLGYTHPSTRGIMRNLASTYRKLNLCEEAERLEIEADDSERIWESREAQGTQLAMEPKDIAKAIEGLEI